MYHLCTLQSPCCHPWRSIHLKHLPISMGSSLPDICTQKGPKLWELPSHQLWRMCCYPAQMQYRVYIQYVHLSGARSSNLLSRLYTSFHLMCQRSTLHHRLTSWSTLLLNQAMPRESMSRSHQQGRPSWSYHHLLLHIDYLHAPFHK